MNIQQETRKLLEEIGPGKMSSTAYDTAWVARLEDIDPDLSNRALEWLRENQLPDGSWGAAQPFYYHDRVISTLGAMIALTHRGRRANDKLIIEKGTLALEHLTSGVTLGLAADPNGATVGFEMIAPTLVTEAQNLGLLKRRKGGILEKLKKQRTIKMGKLSGMKINKFITPAFSAEMAGRDHLHLLDTESLQENDGSVGHSPSATAYFSNTIKPNDAQAVSYLRKWAAEDGGFPTFAPIDVFEIAWAIQNISLIPDLDEELIKWCQPHLDKLSNAWEPGHGIGTALECTIKDSDDSAVVFEVLTRFGRNIDIEAILGFEEEDHFRCFTLENNPSISANIHILGAFGQAHLESSHPAVRKSTGFLTRAQKEKGYWLDKWHASPYYATGHAIIALLPYDASLASHAIQWLLKTQRANGSWGFYKNSTAEETAYALQALCKWNESGGNIPADKITQAYNWLGQHYMQPYEPLWIGKGLYSPQLVIRSTILSALALVEKVAAVNWFPAQVV